MAIHDSQGTWRGGPPHPMANEPALRRFLEFAFQSSAPAAITPESFWRSAMHMRNWNLPAEAAATRRPNSVIRSPIQSSVVTSAESRAAKLPAETWVDLLIDECIRLWLNSLDSPGTARDVAANSSAPRQQCTDKLWCRHDS